MIEISNEDSLTRHYYDGTLARLPDPYATELRRQWNAWLRPRRQATSRLLNWPRGFR